MASVYANAYLTIAATATRDCDDGCFEDRGVTKAIEVTKVTGVRSRLFVRKRIEHGMFDWGIPGSLKAGIRTATRGPEALSERYLLFSRGWCFQERLLSPRILHCTRDEIVWECLGMTSCEYGTLDRFVGTAMLRERHHAAGVPSDVEILCNKLDLSRNLAQKLGLEDLDRLTIEFESNFWPPSVYHEDHALMFALIKTHPRSSAEVITPQVRWRDLVAQCSQRALPYTTDALPAPGGVAQRWGTISPELGSYLAGLWEHDLCQGLLRKRIDDLAAIRPKDYVAPSWSWASVRRAVDWPLSAFEPVYHIEVIDADCQPKGRNAFGEIASARIRLRGPVVNGTKRVDGHLQQGIVAVVRKGDEYRLQSGQH